MGSQLDFRDIMRNVMGSELINAGPEGITPGQQQAMDLYQSNSLNKFSDIYNDNMKQTIGKLQGAGALRSSLLGENLKRGVFDAHSDNLLGLQSNLATQREGFLNDASNRTAQRMQSLMGGFQTGGGTGGLGQLDSAYKNPGDLGQFTDPQSIDALLKQVALNMGARKDEQEFLNNMYTRPTAFNQNPSGGGSMGGTIGSVLGGAVGSLIPIPGVGTALGSAIGGAIGRKF